jgi:hypothetical protein
LVGKPEGRNPHGRPRHRWEYNIRKDLKEVRWEVENWVHLDQDRNQWRALLNMVMNLRVS